MDSVDAVVVGAGVVGLAAARALALCGLGVLILEAESGIGSGISSRNSEVIHAGLHGAAGSLKVRLCVAGRKRLYRYCEERHVAHSRCGKLLVATGVAELPLLDRIVAQGSANGVDDLRRIGAAEAASLEPALACVGAVLSPSSGIVDSHALMTSLLGDAENAGALLALRSPFAAARRESTADGRWLVETGGAEPFVLATRWLVNAAGLSAQAVASAMDGFPRAAVPPLFTAKGNYFALSGRAPFSRLIYPMPTDGGLGVHLTLDLGGQARFGPDVEWLIGDGCVGSVDNIAEPIDYAVDTARLPAFEREIRRYWPALPDGALQPAYSGVRPKLSGAGAPVADFVIAGPGQHGCGGVVQLFGIESPGLTASLAIAEVVASLVCG